MNNYTQHIIVVPEDDANRQIANGFLSFSNINADVIRILPPAKGWTKVCSSFENNHVDKMFKFEKRIILLLVDFDNKYETRFDYIKNKILDDLQDRVFIIGVCSEPEDLKKN